MYIGLETYPKIYKAFLKQKEFMFVIYFHLEMLRRPFARQCFQFLNFTAEKSAIRIYLLRFFLVYVAKPLRILSVKQELALGVLFMPIFIFMFLLSPPWVRKRIKRMT